MRLHANKCAHGMPRTVYKASDIRASAHLLAFGSPFTPKTSSLYFLHKIRISGKNTTFVHIIQLLLFKRQPCLPPKGNLWQVNTWSVLKTRSYLLIPSVETHSSVSTGNGPWPKPGPRSQPAVLPPRWVCLITYNSGVYRCLQTLPAANQPSRGNKLRFAAQLLVNSCTEDGFAALLMTINN